MATLTANEVKQLLKDAMKVVCPLDAAAEQYIDDHIDDIMGRVDSMRTSMQPQAQLIMDGMIPSLAANDVDVAACTERLVGECLKYGPYPLVYGA